MTNAQTEASVSAAREFLRDPDGASPETIEAASDIINAVVASLHRLAESVAAGVGMDPTEVNWNALIALVSHDA